MRCFGFKNTLEFKRAVRDFAEANRWAFKTLSKVHALIENNFTNILNKGPQDPPTILYTVLECMQNPQAPLNPACTFRLFDYYWVTVDELRSIDNEYAEQWDTTAPLREHAFESYGSYPQFKGLAATVFSVRDTHFSTIHYYPMFHGDLVIGPLDLERGSAMRSILEDIATFTKGSIDVDMAFREIEEAPHRRPLPGRLVKRDGNWVWEASFASWGEFLRSGKKYRELDVLMDVVSRLQSGYSVLDLLYVSQRL